MKYFNLRRTIMSLCIIFVAACEEDREITIEDKPGVVESSELAIFKFQSGHTFTLTTVDLGNHEFMISADMTGPVDQQVFIDRKNNSLLTIYLLLTPDSYPVPQILMDFATANEKSRVLAKRQIVEKLDEPVRLLIDEVPEKLVESLNIPYREAPSSFGYEKNDRAQGWCETLNISGIDNCKDWTCDKHIWISSKRYKYSRAYTYVSKDSDSAVRIKIAARTIIGWSPPIIDIYVDPGTYNDRFCYSTPIIKRKWKIERLKLAPDLWPVWHGWINVYNDIGY